MKEATNTQGCAQEPRRHFSELALANVAAEDAAQSAGLRNMKCARNLFGARYNWGCETRLARATGTEQS